MPFTPIISLIHDNGAKLILLKAYTPLIGFKATALLMHLCSAAENEYRQVMQNGKIWYKQNYVWLQYHTTLSENGIRKAKERLLVAELIEVEQQQGHDRTSLWRVREDTLTQFFSFAHAVRLLANPVGKNNEYGKWELWSSQNSFLLEKFSHLWVAENKLACPPQGTEMVRTKAPVKINRRLVVIPVKLPPATVKPCRYVEHWNQQADVPKCRIGSKSYEKARAFFKAHRYFKAGQRDFILAGDEQIRLKLNIVNKVTKVGETVKTAVRSDKQMKDHIEKAAHVYSPAFAPQKKAWLPNNLPQFLYNSFAKRGETSLFLECIYVNQPQKIDDVSRDSLLARANEQELDVCACVKRVYDSANDRDDCQELDLRELRAALVISRNILKMYMKIPIDRLSILASHFGSYFDFVEWWENYMQDGHTWKGMPITALDINKDLWRRFIDFVNSDISYNIFTAARVE